MAKKYMLDAKNLSAFTPNIKEVIYTKSIILSVLFCALALVIIFLSSWIEDKSSSVYLGGLTLSGLMLLLGFYRLINKRTQLLYLPTKSKTLSGSVYFDNKQLAMMKEVILQNTAVDFSLFELKGSGNTRLDYVVSCDGKFVAVQLYEYIPYNFESVTDVVCYEDEKASRLSEFILNNHGKF